MVQNKKGLKNPFSVGKSAKIKPTSVKNIIAIVNNMIKKIAIFLIIAFLPLMLIAIITTIITANKLTRKNIYVLSSSGNYYLGRKAHQIKINFNELPHQDMLIKWLVAQTDIIHYQTERELKMENGNLKGYPDLLIETTDNKNVLIECERTRKAKTRYKPIFDSMVSYLKQDYECWWIVPNQAMAKFINERIKEDNWRTEQHKVIVYIN